MKLSYIVGLVALHNDSRPASSPTRTDYLMPSRLIRGAWQSPRRALPGPWGLRTLVQERMSSHIVSRTGVPLQTGEYDIYCDCMRYIQVPPIYSVAHLLMLPASIQVSNELWVPRAISHKISGRESSFCHEIRDYDRKCVISRTSIPEIHILANNWTTFEAAHIFPSEHERLWVQSNYGRRITDMDDAIESSKINSPQNGFLLMSAVQKMFDACLHLR